MRERERGKKGYKHKNVVSKFLWVLLKFLLCCYVIGEPLALRTDCPVLLACLLKNLDADWNQMKNFS